MDLSFFVVSVQLVRWGLSICAITKRSPVCVAYASQTSNKRKYFRVLSKRMHSWNWLRPSIVRRLSVVTKPRFTKQLGLISKCPKTNPTWANINSLLHQCESNKLLSFFLNYGKIYTITVEFNILRCARLYVIRIVNEIRTPSECVFFCPRIQIFTIRQRNSTKC